MNSQINSDQTTARNASDSFSFSLYAFLIVSTLIFINAGIWAVASSGASH